MWKAPAVNSPTTQKVRQIAESLNLECSEDEITTYTDTSYLAQTESFFAFKGCCADPELVPDVALMPNVHEEKRQDCSWRCINEWQILNHGNGDTGQLWKGIKDTPTWYGLLIPNVTSDSPCQVFGNSVLRVTIVLFANINSLVILKRTWFWSRCSPELIRDEMQGYQRIHEMVEPTLPVKYPRTPGYRPRPDENEYNAWYYRCDIKGAGSGKLWGYKIGIKDNTAVAGVPMMNGSLVLEGYVPEYNATVVTKILDAGGQILGKTACDNCCLGLSGFSNAIFPVLNPLNKEYISGGSSAGSAALLAAGEIDMAIGADQGGSIRVPAAFCGIVGLKPTFGLVPYTGCIPMDMTVDHCGPMAKTVYDCALMLEVLAGYDEGRDPRQPTHIVVPEYSKMLTGDLTGKRIAIVREGFESNDPDVAEIVRAAVYKLGSVGAVIEEVSVPVHKDGLPIHQLINVPGMYQTLTKDYGHTVGWKGQHFPSLLDKLAQGIHTRSLDFSESFKRVMIMGEYMKTSYHGRFYAKAQNMAMYLTQEYNKVFKDYDVMIMPTVGTKIPKLPSQESTLLERIKSDRSFLRNTAPFDVSGHPSVSVCAGLCGGFPVGMMITGRLFEDATVLQVAYAVEKMRSE